MKEKNTFLRTLKLSFPTSLPVLTGFLVLGMAYGLLMNESGYGPLWSALFGVVCYCGSMQFAAIPFLTGAFQPLQVFLLAIMVNARHLFYGLSMLDKYSSMGKTKNFLIYYMSDETFAINSSSAVPEGLTKKEFFTAITLLDLCYWVIGSTLGGILGSVMNINTAGLDFSLTALFAVLFVEQLKTKQKTLCGVIGAAAAVLAVLLFGPENLVIPAMVIIFGVLLLGRKQLCD